MLGPAKKYIYAICSPEKSDFPLFVTSYKRDDDNLRLFSLKVVYSSNSEFESALVSVN